MTMNRPTTSLLTAADAKRLSSMLALAESDKNPALGERIAAVAAAEKLLARRGLRLRDLVAQPETADGERYGDDRYGDSDDGWSPPAQPPEWKRLVIWAITHPAAPAVLSAWERSFLASLARFPSASARQLKVLARIVWRLRGSRACSL
jgi:hypothetical protein